MELSGIIGRETLGTACNKSFTHISCISCMCTKPLVGSAGGGISERTLGRANTLEGLLFILLNINCSSSM